MNILSKQATIDKLEGAYHPATALDSVNNTPSNDNSQGAILSRIRQNFPGELLALPQWVCWRYEHSPKRPKPAKAPYQPSGRRARVDDPRTWGTFADCAQAYLTGDYSGMGFMFTEHGDVTGIDLDHAVRDGYKLDWAIDILRRFTASYAEYSVSETGVHILTRSTAGTVGKRRKNIEVYSQARFFVVTGDRLPSHPSTIAACPDGLDAVLRMIGNGDSQAASTGGCDARDRSNPSSNPSGTPVMADDQLLQRMFAGKNGAAIRALWDGRAGDDPSAADLALCNHLAFWCRNDTNQIDAMFRRSGLYRPKWETRHSSDGRTYGQLTIDRAIAGTHTVYTGKIGKTGSAPVVMVNINSGEIEQDASTGGCDADVTPDAVIAYPVADVIAMIQNYIHAVNLADHVPADKQAANGYRTRDVDVAICDAILETFAGYGKLNGPLGLRQLRRAANLGGLATTHRALDRLAPWFVRPVGGRGTVDAANVYEIAPELIAMAVRTWNTKGYTHTTVDVGVPSTHKTYSEYRAHDNFSATTTPITADDLATREYSERYRLSAIYKRRLEAVLPGAGRTALVIVDALVDAGGMLTRGDLVGLGGRSRFTVYRALKRLVFLDLVTVDGDTVTLRDDWRTRLDSMAEFMPTHGNGERRLVRDAIRTIENCETMEQDAKGKGAATPAWVGTRKERAQNTLKRFAPVYWQMFHAPKTAVTLGYEKTKCNTPTLLEQLSTLRRLAQPLAA